VIELVRSQLSQRDRQRWDAALAEPPILARPWWIDPELAIFGAALFVVPYALTFEPWAITPLVEASLRSLAAAGWLVCVRASLFASRARSGAWPTGRFLYRWGYAQVEDGVLRLVPMHELACEIRGRTLGVGPIRLRLKSGGWSAALHLHADEVEHVATSLEDAGLARLELLTAGYRELPAPVLDGRRAPWRVPRAARELGLALVAGAMGVLLPSVVASSEATTERAPRVTLPAPAEAPPDAPSTDGLRAPYAQALRPREGELRPAVSIELERCTPSPVVNASVAGYLELALTTHNLGVAHTFIPVLAPRPAMEARVWADCSWEVDPVNGTLLRAVARWGLSREGETLLERRAVVAIDDVIRIVDALRPSTREVALAPAGLASLSLLLMEGVIRRDVFEDGGAIAGDESALLDRRLVADAVAHVTVDRVRDP
jgi:hypothetical protein